MSLLGDYDEILGHNFTARNLDTACIDDVRAQRDALLGALAERSVCDLVERYGLDLASLPEWARRELEDEAAVAWFGRVVVAHEVDEVVDRWRLVSIRVEATRGKPARDGVEA